MKNLSKIYNFQDIENKIYAFWLKTGFFNPDKLPKLSVNCLKSQGRCLTAKRKKSYTIVIPPPNVTGELHMGHVLNAVIQDILIRQKRMQKFKTLWLPGTDHAGIATQNIVEKELKKKGKTRFDLGKKKFIKKIWDWEKRYGNIILDQLKKIGASCDWSRTRFTMDKEYTEAVEKAFLYYYKKGWIYQGERTINWCSRCATSLSDLEVEHKDTKSKLWFIKYGNINVATTRPETMLGDTAVAVHPNDKRYKHLIGQKVFLPIQNRKIPIIADKRVNPEFGTGAVKVTPGHSLTDFEISQEQNLEIIKVINQDGKMTKEAGLRFQGLTVLEAREKVIQKLEEQKLVKKVEDYNNYIGHCYRCNTIIEPLISKQWFVKMDKLAKIAIKSVKSGQIKFHPKRFEKTYFDWLGNIKDWCISRQIWWGHQLPVWHCQTGRNSKSQIPNPKLKEKHFLSLKKPNKCLICGGCKPSQSEDVLDTWFSSALWPFAVLGWPKRSKDLKTFYPTDVLITGRDIINLWVTRMIFSGMEFMKKVPFQIVYVHATVLNEQGKRMSKSLGTGIDPINLIEKYGADATRFGIAYQIMGGQDIRFVEDNIVMGKKFCNKIWNAARFVLQQISNSKPKPLQAICCRGQRGRQNLKPQLKIQNLTAADKKILKDLKETVKSVNKDLEDFQFGKAAHTLYDFFWHDFCDIYIEKSKKQNTPETEKILFYVLLTYLKLLHPFMPFITEEIYQILPKKLKQALIIEDWPI